MENQKWHDLSNDKKHELVQVRATPEEKQRLRARAATFGISIGELCRETIFNTTPKAKTDKQAIGELAATRADLGRLGGLLKGWLAGSFQQEPPPPQTLDEVRVLLRRIVDAQEVVVASAKSLVNKP